MSTNRSPLGLLEMALNEQSPPTAVIDPPPAPTKGSARSGLAEIHSFLEHRARQWSNTLRMLEQHRVHVQALENERETECKRLENAVETALRTVRALRAATDLGKDSWATAEVDKAVEANRAALDQVETVAANLNTNFMAWRSSWQQYAQTHDVSKRLRSEMDARLQNHS